MVFETKCENFSTKVALLWKTLQVKNYMFIKECGDSSVISMVCFMISNTPLPCRFEFSWGHNDVAVCERLAVDSPCCGSFTVGISQSLTTGNYADVPPPLNCPLRLLSDVTV